MKQDDARKLDHATLEEMRMRAVRSVQAGEVPRSSDDPCALAAVRSMAGWRSIGEVAGQR